jgi:hypothetical protein
MDLMEETIARNEMTMSAESNLPWLLRRARFSAALLLLAAPAALADPPGSSIGPVAAGSLTTGRRLAPAAGCSFAVFAFGLFLTEFVRAALRKRKRGSGI